MTLPCAETATARALQASPSDNVATMLTPGTTGMKVHLIDEDLQACGEVVLVSDISIYHKVALHPIAQHGSVVKFATRIGRASARIRPGEHVHIHNVRSERLPGDCA